MAVSSCSINGVSSQTDTDRSQKVTLGALQPGEGDQCERLFRVMQTRYTM